ncbi:pentatricopeptide repeat-containing protein At5g39710-like [Lotus japonicus]|uniref:pentatricopeptide repeat-containing protein At5g39710-like n=1 Tax=Lotus japonicus TaxID=34305 RepID=UPI002583858A|nr:pentatricopeptide repeat-containing protein At5g39710-like [Lotus japonicus]
MTEMGLSPDGVSYNTVISGFCRIEELRKAYDLMREMDAKCNWWLDKDVHISLMEDLSYLDPYSSLINGYLAEGNFQVAYTFYCEMLRLGYSSDFDSYCLFMNGLSKKARTRDAKEYLLFMIYDQCFRMPSYVTYDILIENCSNNEFKSLVELVKDLRSRGLMNEAAKAHDTMLEGNYKPDGAVYNLLIFEHCRCLNVDKAYDMYKEMMHYGFAPHMFSLIALINALHYVQMYNEKSWVIESTLRSCNLNDSELRKVLNKINVKERSIYPLLEVLAEIAMDGLLLDGGKCSYASTAASFSPPLSSS